MLCGGDVFSSSTNMSRVRVQGRDGKQADLLLVLDVQEGIRMRVGGAREGLAANRNQTPAVLYRLETSWGRIFGYSDQPNPTLQPQHYNHAIVGRVFFVGIQVHAAYPGTCQRLCARVQAQLGQGVEGEGVVAEDAGLVDLGEEEDLLHAGANWMCVHGLESRGDDGGGLRGRVIGVWGEEDEVEDLSGRGADIEVAVPHLHARYAGIIGRLAVGGQWQLRGELPQDVGAILQRRAPGYLGRRR